MRIETERLIIRAIQKGDEKIFAEMAKDGSFSELGFDENCSEWIGEWVDEAVSLAEQDNPRIDYICSTICLKDKDTVIGNVGNTFYEDTGKIGICYGIGAAYRQQGYASEALKAYLDFFFEHYKEEEIIATILAANEPSCKTAEKSGFKLIETKMYKDIYDKEERLYRFYEVKKR